MDANLFRLPTSPNLYAGKRISKPSVSASFPTEDSRFPGWAAPTQDGRLVTDYRSRRETNIPVESQEKSRIWIQQNAEEIIRISRERLAERSGMIYGVDSSIVPPPAGIVNCSAAGCKRTEVAVNGIGLERADSKAPHLFGTYEVHRPLMVAMPQVDMTSRYEGGRNTKRG
jgi:hypothetical protein